jgi:5-methyltetrahydrofolate--homocysteine methyltransferase
MLLKNHPLSDIVPLIDWSFFFASWEITGRYPDIFNHPTKGKQARELYDDAQKLLAEIVADQSLQANAIAVIYPANSKDDDILLFTDDERTTVLATLPQLRNQELQRDETPNLCLADFVAPAGTKDYIATFALTTGLGLEALTSRYRSVNDEYSVIMAKAIANRLAEAFAVYLHREIAALLGERPTESRSPLTVDPSPFTVNPSPFTVDRSPFTAGRNIGIRAAYGYPACPDHSSKRDLFDLMNAEQAIGVKLTESYMMVPESSISGLIIPNPDARYFSVGKIDEEQLHDYARRKQMPVAQLRKLLAHNLR